MNQNVPRIIQVHPKVHEQLLQFYPGFTSIVTQDFLIDETVIVVDEIDGTYVDKHGIMFINIEYFHFIAAAMKEFFETFKQGVDLTLAFSGLVKLLSGELNGKKS